MVDNFDLYAEDFDTDARKERAKLVAGEIRRHLGAGMSSGIEFGCGTGLVGFCLADAFNNLTFLDSSKGMIDKVEGKIRESARRDLRAVCADIMAESPEIPHADCIFSSLVLHHIPDTLEILKRLHGLLTDGGRLLIVDLDTDDGSFHAKYPDFDGYNGFDNAELCGTAKKAGFQSASAHTFYRNAKSVDGADKPHSFFILIAEK